MHVIGKSGTRCHGVLCAFRPRLLQSDRFHGLGSVEFVRHQAVCHLAMPLSYNPGISSESGPGCRDLDDNNGGAKL